MCFGYWITFPFKKYAPKKDIFAQDILQNMSLPSKKTSKNMFPNDRHQVCERGEWVSSKLVSAYDFGPKTGDGAVRVLPRVRSDPPLAYSWVSVHQKWNMHKKKRGNFRGWSGLKDDMDRCVKIYGFGTSWDQQSCCFRKWPRSPTGGSALSRGDKNPNKAALMFLKLAEAGHEALWLGNGWSGQKHWRSSIHRGYQLRNGIFDLDIGLMFV